MLMIIEKNKYIKTKYLNHFLFLLEYHYLVNHLIYQKTEFLFHFSWIIDRLRYTRIRKSSHCGKVSKNVYSIPSFIPDLYCWMR